jgi:hypothetical protein
MGYFPTNQTVTVTRAGELDIYGKPISPTTLTLKCRAIEGTHITTDKSSLTQGATIVCDLKLQFDKIGDVHYDDIIQYQNEAGTAYKGKPKSIKISRDFGGKPILTEVLL